MSALPPQMATVVGFLVPAFTDPATGANGLLREEFEKVRAGYACADCLAEFSCYTLRCPLCGLERDLARDLGEAPQLWNDHLAERGRGGERTVARTADEAFAELATLPDVDHIPLSKLRPSKWGRGG